MFVTVREIRTSGESMRWGRREAEGVASLNSGGVTLQCWLDLGWSDASDRYVSDMEMFGWTGFQAKSCRWIRTWRWKVSKGENEQLSPSTIYYTITSITQWCTESFIFILRAAHVILRGKWRASYLLHVCHGLSRTVTYIKTIAVVTVCQTGSSVAKKGQMKHIYGCLLLGVMRLACLLFDVAGHWELSIHIQTWLGQFLIIFSNLSYKTAFYPVAFLEITLDSL